MVCQPDLSSIGWSLTPFRYVSLPHPIPAHAQGCKYSKAVTLLLRGANDYMLDEMDRSVHDSLCVVKRVLESGSVVPGGSYLFVEGYPQVQLPSEQFIGAWNGGLLGRRSGSSCGASPFAERACPH